MKSYVLSRSGSGATSEIYAESDEQAIAEAVRLLGGDVVRAEQWDADGRNDDGEPCKRILFWASDEGTAGDPGADAVAQLSTVGHAR